MPRRLALRAVETVVCYKGLARLDMYALVNVNKVLRKP